MTFELTALSGSYLCTRAQVIDRLGISGTGTNDQIDAMIAAVLPRVSNHYGREFMPHATATRTFEVRNRLVSLGAYDLRTVTTMTLHPEATTPTVLTADSDYALMPAALGGTYSGVRLSGALTLRSSDFAAKFGYAQLEIAGAWGIWATTAEVPADIQEAAVECVCSWLDQPSSVIAGIDSGDARAVMPGIPQTWDIPASAHRKFMPYNRNFSVY